MDRVDDPRPQELEVVGQEGKRKRGDGALPDAVLREPGGEGRGNHRVGKAGGHADEERRQRLLLEIGLQRSPQRMRVRSPAHDA
jgi:hypothetical protein